MLTTGHNILQPFLKLWLNLGGIPMAGSPIDDAQQIGDTRVQYFDNLAMTTRGSTVQLLPLGLAAIGGAPAHAAPELSRKTTHLYFPQTGHNLSGRFLTFWKSSGGLAFWGPPVTEPRTIGPHTTVQYFTNAEYVWNGSTVSLAPIGDSAWFTPCRLIVPRPMETGVRAGEPGTAPASTAAADSAPGAPPARDASQPGKPYRAGDQSGDGAWRPAHSMST